MEETSPSRQKIWQIIQALQDKLHLHKRRRWGVLVISLLVYTIRISLIGGYHVVSYCLAILILNQFLLFITPLKADMEDEETDVPVLPVRSPGEFKPFIRKLNEFKLWRNCTVGTIISILCTFSDELNVPVFWPILVIYFIVLFIVTMRRQIAHMVKHDYVPIDIGKEQYTTT